MNDIKNTDELDISWVNDLQTSYIVEIAPPQQFNIHFIYINIDNEIIHSFNTIHKLEKITDDETCIFKEQLLKIIQLNKCVVCKKIQPNQLYRLNQILEYTINLKENEIINTTAKPPYELLQPFTLKKINYINDIKFKPSIVDFHPLNTLYIIYIENDSFQRILKPKLNIFTSKNTQPNPTPAPAPAPAPAPGQKPAPAPGQKPAPAPGQKPTVIIVKKTKKIRFDNLEKPLKLNITKKKT